MAIRPGEQYEHVWGVWDDGPRVFKTCRRCLNLRQFMEKHAHCFCWTFGDVRSAAREEAHEWRGDTGGDLFALGRLEVAILRARKFYAIQRHIVVPAQ
jgi:hypothetical protein